MHDPPFVPTPGDSTAGAPLVSVVVPLPDHREHVFAAISSLVNQNLPAGDFEIIAPSDGLDLALEKAIAAQFPTIHIPRQAGGNTSALYNLGAATARGKYLYFTESHCVADANCLQALLDFVQSEDLDAACATSDGINANAFARGEQRLFEEDIRAWQAKGQGKFTIRGFMILRQRWQRAGGLRAQFGHFAEIMLSRRLQDQGVKIGFASKALVHHCNQTSPAKLSAELIEYGYDECASYRWAPPEDLTLIAGDWVKRERYLRGFGRIQMSLASAYARLFWQRFVMSLPGVPTSTFFRAFVKHWSTSITIGRLTYLAEHRRALRASAAVAARAQAETTSARSRQAA
jgi:glycosyltransferase involved in cell wall biosynthesis